MGTSKSVSKSKHFLLLSYILFWQKMTNTVLWKNPFLQSNFITIISTHFNYLELAQIIVCQNCIISITLRSEDIEIQITAYWDHFINPTLLLSPPFISFIHTCICMGTNTCAHLYTHTYIYTHIHTQTRTRWEEITVFKFHLCFIIHWSEVGVTEMLKVEEVDEWLSKGHTKIPRLNSC